jgi:hypothetical protein
MGGTASTTTQEDESFKKAESELDRIIREIKIKENEERKE